MPEKYIEGLLSKGFHGIALAVPVETREVDDFFGGVERTYAFTVLALDDERGALRIECKIIISHGRSPHRSVSEKKERLTRAEYDALIHALEIIDTPAYRKKMIAQRTQETQRAQAQQRLSQFRVVCPLCRSRLKIKVGQDGPFWSCSRWKRYGGCNYTTSLAPAHREVYQQAQG